MAPERATPWVLLCLGVVVRLAAWWRLGGGIVYPDEIFQSVEPAHLLAFGHGGLAWEWNDGLRSWAVPLFYALPMRFFAALGLDGPVATLRLAQSINVGLSLLAVVASWRMALVVMDRKAAWLCGTAAAVFPVLVYYAPRTLNDGPSAWLVLMGMAAFVAAKGDDATRMAAWSGVWAGAAYGFRFTALLFFVGPGVWLLVTRQWRAAAAMVAGVLVPVVLLGMLDWVTWGVPFHALWKYVDFNVIQGGASKWGVSPPEWYLNQLYRDLGPLAVVALATLARGSAGMQGAGLGLLLGVMAMSAQEHKEERFMLPLWGMLPLLLGLGALQLTKGLGRLQLPAGATLLALLLGSHAWAFKKKDWAPDRALVEATQHAAAMPELQGLILPKGNVVTAGRVCVHRNVPVVALVENEEKPWMPAAFHSSLLNVVVADGLTLDRMRKMAPDTVWDTKATFGPYRVMLRR